MRARAAAVAEGRAGSPGAAARRRAAARGRGSWAISSPAAASARVAVEEAEEAGVIPEGAEEVEIEAEDDTFQESRNLKNT